MDKLKRKIPVDEDLVKRRGLLPLGKRACLMFRRLNPTYTQRSILTPAPLELELEVAASVYTVPRRWDYFQIQRGTEQVQIKKEGRLMEDSR